MKAQDITETTTIEEIQEKDHELALALKIVGLLLETPCKFVMDYMTPENRDDFTDLIQCVIHDHNQNLPKVN